MSNQRHATPKKKPPHSGLPSFTLNISTATVRLLGKLTRLQIIVLSVAMCSIVFGLGTSLTSSPSPTAINSALPAEQSSDRKVIELTLGDATDADHSRKAVTYNSSLSNASSAIDNRNTGQASPTEAALEQPQAVRNIVRMIEPGDTLSEVFDSVGLSANDVLAITTSGAEGKALVKMFPGESLAFEFTPGDTLARVSRDKSPLETIHFTPSQSGFDVERITRTPDIKRVNHSGIVEHSLSRAAEKAGLPASTTMNMANIFGGVMDFVLDVRSGDRFTVIYEEHYLNDKKFKDGAIIAAQYVNNGMTYNAFRYVHENGDVGYYNEEGISMRKAFLRAPLDFTRVSSSFNLKRLHPITKQVKPHRGIDYAAKRGTPIFSVGDGRVVTSGYSKANGNYIVVKHGEAYTTKYLHLHKRNVKRGQRVKQGQIIGQVGCTGLCTGPHLHYEFLVNGVHRNPRTIIKKLPKAKKLAGTEMPSFSQATASTHEILQHFSNQFELASLSLSE